MVMAIMVMEMVTIATDIIMAMVTVIIAMDIIMAMVMDIIAMATTMDIIATIIIIETFHHRIITSKKIIAIKMDRTMATRKNRAFL